MKKRRVLIFTGKGTATPYILKDCSMALKRAGCEVADYCITINSDATRDVIRRINPDIIFTIDYFGLTKEIVNEEKRVFVSWFVDNPFYYVDETHIKYEKKVAQHWLRQRI